MAGSDPYSSPRIVRGVAYLAGGKVVTSIAGIGTFLLLVQALPVPQFAAYSVLFALVELIEAVTGVGLTHILARYVPELFAENRRNALRRLVLGALALRSGVLALVLGAIYLLAPQVSALIGLSDWEWAVTAYLAVVFVRVVSVSLFSILESMLHQAVAQLGFGLVTVMRFALIALAASQGTLELQTVIVIELITDILGLGVMLVGVMRAMPGDVEGEPTEGANWLRANLRRMLEFGMKGYLQHMLIMPYGGAVNRVLVGGSLVSSDVALFGFAQSVADLMERYLPVKLLAGVIRPVLTARYVRDRRFSDLAAAANLIFKLNAMLVCAAAVVISSGGEPLLAAITAGKYSEAGAGLLLLMCALVFMYSLRHMLDHVSHAVERNGPLIWSNAVITCSMLPGIALLPTLGVYALPAANLLGLIVGTAILVWRLRREGFDYRHDMVGVAGMLAAAGLGMGVGELVRWAGFGWIVVMMSALMAFSFVMVVLLYYRPEERRLATSLFRRR